MKKQISDIDAEMAAGGVVVITDTNWVGFTSTGEKFKLVNCTWQEARDLRDQLLQENPTMENRKFDELCKQTYLDNGWI